MAPIYTGGGDRGTTRLWDGTKVSKRDLRIQLNGTLDEANAALGVAKSGSPTDALKEEIGFIQRELMDLMSFVARGERDVPPPQASRLEEHIDALQEQWPAQGRFVLPGGSLAGSAAHQARAIVRRAERLALELLEEELFDEEAYVYVNRLSDLLYALALACDGEAFVGRVTALVMAAEKASTAARGMTLARAKELLAQAEGEAERVGVPMVVAAVDGSGDLVALHRMDGALPASIDLAPRKAKTAARLRMTTEALSRLVQPGAPLYGLASDPGLCCFGGGVPLQEAGETVGAVGVSGGTVEEDQIVAGRSRDVWESLFQS